MAYYRYATATETAIVSSRSPMRVPNFNRWGTPKQVYFTDALFSSIAAAESALQIGRLHPSPPGPFASPSDRFDLDLYGCTFWHNGIVPGGTAEEFVTPDEPEVTAIAGLGP